MKYNLDNFPESPQGISCQCKVCKWIKGLKAELREMHDNTPVPMLRRVIKEILGE